MVKYSFLAGVLLVFSNGSLTAQETQLSTESQALLQQLRDKIALTANKVQQLEIDAGNGPVALRLSQPETTRMPLGITLNEQTLTVGKVVPSSLAEQIGIIPGDTLVAINDKSLTGASMMEVYSEFSQLEPGEQVKFKLVRAGKSLELIGEAQELTVPGYTLAINLDRAEIAEEEQVDESGSRLHQLLKRTGARNLQNYRYRFLPAQSLPTCNSQACKATFETYEKYEKYAKDKKLKSPAVSCDTEQCEAIFESFAEFAKLGAPAAQLREAEFYYYGYGVPQNKDIALKKFKPLAKWRGVAYAQYMTAVIYLEQNNYEQARKYMRRAARGKSVRGMYELGMAYLIGDWIEQDLELADKWLAKAYNYAPNKLSTFSAKLKANYPDVFASLPKLQQVLKTTPDEYLVDGNGNSMVWKRLVALHSKEQVYEAEIKEYKRVKRKTRHDFKNPHHTYSRWDIREKTKPYPGRTVKGGKG